MQTLENNSSRVGAQVPARRLAGNAKSSPRAVGRGAAKGPRWRLLLIPFLLAAPGLGGPAGSAARDESDVSKEYQVKAAFLLNFVQFVDWPAAAFPEPTTPISIGILGADPFGPYLDQIARDETVKSRSLIIRRSRDLADLKTCHVIFVSRSESGNTAQILAGLEQSSVLAIGETEGFAARGGIINFFIEGHQLRFEVNREAAGRCGLAISSKLLSLGRIVATSKGKERR